MMVERGLNVMNVEIVGDSYGIASNYLRKRGAIPDIAVTNDRLLQIIVEMFHRGDTNKISLANRGDLQVRSSTTRSLMSAEEAMNTAIDRIMKTYDLMANRTAAANDEAREKVSNYIKTLFEGGEKDPHRLTVFGLTYLRELDGSNDPVKAGFTGL